MRLTNSIVVWQVELSDRCLPQRISYINRHFFTNSDSSTLFLCLPNRGITVAALGVLKKCFLQVRTGKWGRGARGRAADEFIRTSCAGLRRSSGPSRAAPCWRGQSLTRARGAFVTEILFFPYPFATTLKRFLSPEQPSVSGDRAAKTHGSGGIGLKKGGGASGQGRCRLKFYQANEN